MKMPELQIKVVCNEEQHVKLADQIWKLLSKNKLWFSGSELDQNFLSYEFQEQKPGKESRWIG